ncbi:MAG: hypothetical protein H5T69_12345 [Chloroflexi bacterium]|nr:hypothetical protein [Chloroflexota bacterium]
MKRKGHPFRNGLIAGLVWPLCFLGGVVVAVYRLTGMVPFPVRRLDEGELVVRLVDPAEVPSYWRRWQAELLPLIERARQVAWQLRTAHNGDWLEQK